MISINEDLVPRMRRIIGESQDGVEDDALLQDYLRQAGMKIMNRRYPFGIPSGVTAVEPQYEEAQLEIAVYLFNKRGAEGESLHSENGVSRSYGGQTDIPPDLLIRVTPIGRVC